MTVLDNIRLARGAHELPADECDNPERCLFEWYNWLTRQQHTDSRPPGVSPILHTFGIQLHDVLPDGKRQELRRFLPNGQDRLAGTETDGKDETRSYLALDWLIRTWTPVWLERAGLTAEATGLRNLRRIADLVAAQSAGPVVREARDKAAAASAAASAVASAAARAAARAALAPTVAHLQDSAIALYDLMITGEWPDENAA